MAEDKPKPGLLVEDQNTLEVRDQTGQEKLIRTNDRGATAKALQENGREVRPTHPTKPMND